jgi:hypothetical protein
MVVKYPPGAQVKHQLNSPHTLHNRRGQANCQSCRRWVLGSVDVSVRLLGDKRPKSEIYKARPYTRAVCAPQSKGMGQWQLTSPAKGEFASKKCSNMF